MEINTVWQILEQGQKARDAAFGDQRLSEQGRKERGAEIWAAALASARETAAAVLAADDKRVADAEQRLASADAQHEKSIDYARLAVLQTEWKSLAEHSDFYQVSERVESAIKNGDALSVRAATTAFPSLKARARSEMALREHGGAIEELDRRLFERRAELEPAALRNARKSLDEAVEQRLATGRTLYSYNERTAQNGGPGIFNTPGVTVVEYKKDGGMIFSRSRGTMW